MSKLIITNATKAVKEYVDRKRIVRESTATEEVAPPQVNLTEEAEKQAQEVKETGFDIDFIAEKIILFGELFDNIKLFPYQRQIAEYIIKDILMNNGSIFTVLIARQAGKTEVLATIIKSLSILLPKLAKLFPAHLSHFEKGFKVGIFAPEKTIAKTLFSRVVDSLDREEAKPFLLDKSIETSVESRNPVKLSNGSLIRNHTLLSKNLVSFTYDFIIIDEAHRIPDDQVVTEDVYPMGSATNATIALVGVAGENECLFSNTIMGNKLADTVRHFEFDYKHVQQFNNRYKKYVAERLKDVVEGRISKSAFDRGYSLIWGHESSLFMNKERLQSCMDEQCNYSNEDKNPDSLIVAGIDLGKKVDSTVVTLLKYIKNPKKDKFLILKWLQIDGLSYSEQKSLIFDFLNNYYISTILIDSTGIGEAIADDFETYYANTGVFIDRFNYSDKSKSFGYMQLDASFDIGRISIPASYKVQQTPEFKRFKKDCFSSVWVQRKNFMLVESPATKQKTLHDDYLDSLMLANLCLMNELDNNSIESFDSLY